MPEQCYTAAHGEDGRPETVHERRTDGSCPCGYYRLHRFAVTLTEDNGPGRVDTFTWGVSYRHAYNRAAREIENPVWVGWSFQVAQTPTV